MDDPYKFPGGYSADRFCILFLAVICLVFASVDFLLGFATLLTYVPAVVGTILLAVFLFADDRMCELVWSVLSLRFWR
jgi:hypothetical protein